QYTNPFERSPARRELLNPPVELGLGPRPAALQRNRLRPEQDDRGVEDTDREQALPRSVGERRLQPGFEQLALARGHRPLRARHQPRPPPSQAWQPQLPAAPHHREPPRI